MFRVYTGNERDAAGCLITVEQRAEALALLKQAACNEFGGATITSSEGIWRNPATQVIVAESVWVFDLGTQDYHAVVRFATYARNLLAQSSVGVQQIGNTPMEFI